MKQFNLAKEGSIKRIKNSNDPQTIFSEINRLQEGKKATKGAEFTSEEQTIIDNKLKELKDKGYTFKTKKGEILRSGENIRVDDNQTLLKPNEVTNLEKELLKKELDRREKLKQDLIKNGYTEDEAVLESELNENETINIVSKDLEVTVLKNGIQEKSGKVAIRFISVKDAEQSLKETTKTETTPTTSNQSEIEAKKADIERRRQEELKYNDKLKVQDLKTKVAEKWGTIKSESEKLRNYIKNQFAKKHNLSQEQIDVLIEFVNMGEEDINSNPFVDFEEYSEAEQKKYNLREKSIKDSELQWARLKYKFPNLTQKQILAIGSIEDISGYIARQQKGALLFEIEGESGLPNNLAKLNETKINAKYDAELKALEEAFVTQFEIEAKIADIKSESLLSKEQQTDPLENKDLKDNKNLNTIESVINQIKDCKS